LNNNPPQAFTRSIQGQLLRSSERREAAIFLRDGALWVADFIDSQGDIVDAITWFRFNCGSISTSHARRRMVHESATPLSEELVARIERLPRPPSAQTGVARAGWSKPLLRLCRRFGWRRWSRLESVDAACARRSRPSHGTTAGTTARVVVDHEGLGT
jgi:hypothetical protein